MDIYRQIGQRIKLAREALGLSQEQFGRLVSRETGESYSGTAVSYFETGQRKIKVEDLPAFAAALNKPVAYLFPLDHSGQQPSVSFMLRTDTSLNPSARNQVETFYAFVATDAAGDSRPLDIRLSASALVARARVDHAPIDPASLAEEQLGIRVLAWPFDDSLSGVLVADGERAAIGYNSGHPLRRQRFSIAHELGHYCLGHNRAVSVDLYDPFSGGPSALEGAANRFAAQLLMPSDLVKDAIDQIGEADVVALAAKFMVSEQAMWIRLAEIDFEDQVD